MFELWVNKYKIKVFVCNDGNWRHDNIFIYNNTKCIAEKEIETKMIALRSQGAVKPLKLKATEEQIKKGAPATYEVPITFDTANFFV